MIYYIALLGYVLLLRFVTAKYSDKKTGDRLFMIFSCLGVVLFQGFRDFSVGNDLKHYIPYFEQMGQLPFGSLHIANFEPGYVLVNKILYKLGFSERGLLIFLAALIQVPVFYTIYKYSTDKLLSLLWYFSFGEFIFTFSGLRQAIAMSICLCGFCFIKEKKFLKFFLVCVIAATFHKSALIALVLYPAYHIKISNKWLLVTGSLCVLVFLFQEEIMGFVTKFLYSEYGSITSTGAYTMVTAYFVLYILSFLNKNPDDDFMGMRNILLILVLIYCFAPSSNVFTRAGFVMELYMSLFVPRVISSFNFRPQKLYYLVCCGLLSVCMFRFVGMFHTLPFKFAF